MKTKQNKKPKTTDRHHRNNHIYIIWHINTTKTTGKSPSLTETCSNAIMDYNNNNNNISIGGAKNPFHPLLIKFHVILPIHQNAPYIRMLEILEYHKSITKGGSATSSFLRISTFTWPLTYQLVKVIKGLQDTTVTKLRLVLNQLPIKIECHASVQTDLRVERETFSPARQTVPKDLRSRLWSMPKPNPQLKT